jgi:hypothetical protein
MSAEALNSILAMSATGKVWRCPSLKTITSDPRVSFDIELCPKLAIADTSTSIPKETALAMLRIFPPRGDLN